MRKKRLLILIGTVCLSLMLLVPFGAACAKPAPAPAPEPIVLKAISSPRPDQKLAEGINLYINTVNDRAKGELTIDYLGGPEVIPIGEQFMAVKQGVADMGFLYSSIVVGGGVKASIMIHLFREMPDVHRQRGLDDFLQQENNKVGLYLIGQWLVAFDYVWIFTDKFVERPQELAGQRVATYPAVIPWVEAMGMTALMMPPADRYGAVERGIADAVATDIGAIVDSSYYEVCKYFLDQGALGGSNWIHMNMDSWNKLPKNLQDLLINTQLELLPQFIDMWVKQTAESRQAAIDLGMKPIKFSPADNDWFIEKAYEGSWKEFYEKYPDLAPIMYEFLKKG